jgi:NAD(P)-dependent dehydrogenase (short-subunit alcohol dehydrogenase family)
MPETAVVAGVGPGFGETLVRRLAEEGYAVAAFARSADYLADLEADLRNAGHDALGVPTDLADPDAVEAGFAAVRDELGSVDVFVYNPSVPAPGHLFELDADDFDAVLDVVLRGAFHATREAVADMTATPPGVEAGADVGTDSGDAESGDADGGVVLFTGTSIAKRAFGNLLAWDLAGPGLRGFAQSLARRFGSEGVHVSYVVVDGAIGGAGGEGDVPRDRAELIDPDAMAETYLAVIQQDERAWTFELDVRAYGDEMRT